MLHHIKPRSIFWRSHIKPRSFDEAQKTLLFYCMVQSNTNQLPLKKKCPQRNHDYEKSYGSQAETNVWHSHQVAKQVNRLVYVHSECMVVVVREQAIWIKWSDPDTVPSKMALLSWMKRILADVKNGEGNQDPSYTLTAKKQVTCY